MRQLLAIFAITGTLMLPAGPVRAADAVADAFGACLLAKTTATDRIEMARWVALAITAHPAAADIVRVTPAQLEATDRRFAAIVDRLVLVECRAEARAATITGGAAAFGAAFRTLGEAAMREATGSADVKTRLGKFTGYIDKAKWAALAQPTK